MINWEAVPALVGIIFLFYLIIAWIADRNKEEMNNNRKLVELQRAAGNALLYDAENETITVNEIREDTAQRIFPEKYVSKIYGFTPEKLVYTSATVGGVTTGGIDKVGGAFTNAKVNTDKYRLVYKNAVCDTRIETGYIKKIRLSKEIAKKVSGTPIEEFYDDGYIIVESAPSPKWEQLKTTYAKLYGASKYGISEYSNIQEAERVDTLPTIEKCQLILNWICGRTGAGTTNA